MTKHPYPADWPDTLPLDDDAVAILGLEHAAMEAVKAYPKFIAAMGGTRPARRAALHAGGVLAARSRSAWIKAHPQK